MIFWSNIWNLKDRVFGLIMLIKGLLSDTGRIILLFKRLNLLSAREVLPDTSLSLELLVARIEDSQSFFDLIVIDEVAAVHPE